MLNSESTGWAPWVALLMVLGAMSAPVRAQFAQETGAAQRLRPLTPDAAYYEPWEWPDFAWSDAEANYFGVTEWDQPLLTYDASKTQLELGTPSPLPLRARKMAAPSPADRWVNCVPTVDEETDCDGVDNDCDGLTDEAFDDGVACTLSSCVLGVPQNAPNDGACDDQNPCTLDTCQPATGGCVHDSLTNVQADDVKADGNACTQIDCTDGVGSSVPDDLLKPDDGMACTVDTCSAGVDSHALLDGFCTIAGACVPKDETGGKSNCGVCKPEFGTDSLQDFVHAEDFDYPGQGPNDEWSFTTLTQTPAVVWHFSSKRSVSDKKSLAFHYPKNGTYAYKNKRVHGHATSRVIDLPAGSQTLLEFHLWLETEAYLSSNTVDVLFVEILDASGQIHTLWDSAKGAQGDTKGEFRLFSVSLGAFAGQPVRLRFRFDTGDALNNGYAGAFIDAITFRTVCCVTSADCGDNDSCTVDSCSNNVCAHLNTCLDDCPVAGRQLILVSDASDGMAWDASPDTQDTRWQALGSAFQASFGPFEGIIDAGLKLFPTPDVFGNCTVLTTDGDGAPHLDLPLGAGAAAVASYLSFLTPSGATPAAKGLQGALAAFLDAEPSDDRVVIFLTTSKDVCGGSILEDIQALSAAGIQTAVFAYGQGFDADSLNEAAVWGGLARAVTVPAEPRYFEIHSELELQAAFETVFALMAGERCNAVDDDCDGSIDEDVPSESCRFSCQGAWKDGYRYCDQGSWSSCQEDQVTETCNGLDDNCSGVVDDPWVDGLGPVLGEACIHGVGACAVAGVSACPPSGVGEAVCLPFGVAEPGFETCNNVDDDCDGEVDESLTQACVTACGEGVVQCFQGAWVGCTASCDQDLSCDGVDNDQDGVVDNLFPEIGQACDGPDPDACPDEVYACSEDTLSALCGSGNVVLSWGFDEGSGNTTQDLSGHEHSGVFQGTVHWVDGEATGAGLFDGVSGTTSAAVDVPESNFTMTARFRTAHDGGIFSVTSGDIYGSSGHDRHLFIEDGHLGYRVWPGVTSLCAGKGPKVYVCTAEVSPGICPGNEAVLRWDFDASHVDLAANFVQDTTGNGLGGFASVALQLHSFGRFAEAFDVAESQGLVAVQGDVPEVNFTINAWFRTYGEEGGILSSTVGDALGQGGSDRHLSMVNGHLTFEVHPDAPENCVDMGPKINTGKWHMGTIVCDKGVSCELYLDGQKICEDGPLYGLSMLYNQDHFVVGHVRDIGFFPGDIDEVTVDAYVMQPADIVALYQHGNGARTGAWQTGTIVCESGVACDLYLNGMKVAPCSSAPADSESDFNWQTTFIAGYSEDAGFFEGALDYVVVESVAKSASEVLEMDYFGHPDVQSVEVCDGLDNDCDGVVDEPGALGCVARWADADGDGFGVGDSICLCAPSGFYTAPAGGDCNDASAAAHPGAEEICDGIDNDCDTHIDTPPGSAATALSATCYGGPKDTVGVGVCTSGVSQCVNGAWTGCLGEVTPISESCDGLDQDCDGVADVDEPSGSEDASGHPCYATDWCEFGVCYCMNNKTTQVWSCVLE